MSDATTIAIEGPTSPNTIVVVDSGDDISVILYTEQGASNSGVIGSIDGGYPDSPMLGEIDGGAP